MIFKIMVNSVRLLINQFDIFIIYIYIEQFLLYLILTNYIISNAYFNLC